MDGWRETPMKLHQEAELQEVQARKPLLEQGE